MRAIALTALAVVVSVAAVAAAAGKKQSAQAQQAPVLTVAKTSPLIDYDGFLQTAKEVQAYRQKRRVSETQFLKMSREEGTIILDTRSAAGFKKRHIRGAVHLNFSDFTAEKLAKTIPSKETRILIYCNNNFFNEPAFPSKAFRAALNIPTFATLYEYGYRNVYELQPLLDARTTKLPLVGSAPTSSQTLRQLTQVLKGQSQ